MMPPEWKEKLKAAGILLFCYLMVPFIVQWALGACDNLYGGLTASNLAQAGIAVYIIRKFLSQREPLTAELKAWLDGRGQPPERTLELTGKVANSAGYVCAAALLLPPVGDTFPGSLISFVKYCAVAYTAWMAYDIWKLAEPYLAYLPPAEPEAVQGEPPALAVGRCVKCGQQLTSTMKTCAFCGHPVN